MNTLFDRKVDRPTPEPPVAAPRRTLRARLRRPLMVAFPILLASALRERGAGDVELEEHPLLELGHRVESVVGHHTGRQRRPPATGSEMPKRA